MKICAAQTRPVKGDVQRNIDNHKKLIDLAVSGGANVIIFPELSITGYEPELAKELATDKDDRRFDDFQKIADEKQITIGVGVPTKNNTGISISMIIFQPSKARQIYSKKYLHSSEKPFFVGGQKSIDLRVNNTNVALAVCYEISIPEHAENAFQSGAELYLASVVESVEGVEKAVKILSGIAERYSMTVLMANCVGKTGVYDCGGKTSVWNDQGSLVGQLNDTDEGIIIFDTDTRKAIEKTI